MTTSATTASTATLPAGAQQALFRTEICVFAVCAGCGSEPHHAEHDYRPRFASPAQASQILTGDYGWVLRAGDDGQQTWLCDLCAARQECALSGHQPTERTIRDGTGMVSCVLQSCERCAEVFSCTIPGPLPAGCPVAEPQTLTISWNAASFPDGAALARAAARIVAGLSDLATAAQWDAWPGDQTGRPPLNLPADAGTAATAAQILLEAAGDPGSTPPGPGGTGDAATSGGLQ